MKKLSILFLVVAIVLSHIMCAVVAYVYRDMICGIQHEGYSAPASVAFIYGIPFVVAIILFVILSFVFYKKNKN